MKVYETGAFILFIKPGYMSTFSTILHWEKLNRVKIQAVVFSKMSYLVEK